MDTTSIPANNNGIIALLNVDDVTFTTLELCNFGGLQLMKFDNGVQFSTRWKEDKLNVAAIISESEVLGPQGVNLIETLQRHNFPDVPFFLISEVINENLSRICIQARVADVLQKPLKKEQAEPRINFLIKNWNLTRSSSVQPEKIEHYRIPLAKRIFDIVFSGLALICLSPFFLILMIIMKIESKGPIFYYALRVGTGYRTFKFYKFRSMYVNADKRLKDLSHLNQYAGKEDVAQAINSNMLCDQCISAGTSCQRILYADKNSWCEKHYLNHRKSLNGGTFFKLKNDPRVTKVGKFIRNTSIDELPQLWNVFIGDMSIVGNRPLPLYEAEKLTTDKYALRFRAPAGITGLWQVEKRGKGEMSEEERLMLDNAYAENHSFVNDIRLIIKTIPALLQKENV